MGFFRLHHSHSLAYPRALRKTNRLHCANNSGKLKRIRLVRPAAGRTLVAASLLSKRPTAPGARASIALCRHELEVGVDCARGEKRPSQGKAFSTIQFSGLDSSKLLTIELERQYQAAALCRRCLERRDVGVLPWQRQNLSRGHVPASDGSLTIISATVDGGLNTPIRLQATPG